MSEPRPEPIWRATSLPTAPPNPLVPGTPRVDDIWFVTPDLGWAVNSSGQIHRTDDGGASWCCQFRVPPSSSNYLRSITFGDDLCGWAGAMWRPDAPINLYYTSDGGQTWAAIDNLPPDGPQGFCGLFAVNARVVYGSGTTLPWVKPAVLKTVDGGRSWRAIDMRGYARTLIDIAFEDELRGWVTGGRSVDPIPDHPPTNPSQIPQYFRALKPVLLRTEDGGETWHDALEGMGDAFPKGEFGWKIQFLDAAVGFVSLENSQEAAFLRTEDGGRTWTRISIQSDPPAREIQGIGFADRDRGWVGSTSIGSGRWPGEFLSFATSDGGRTWTPDENVGRNVNRFRFFGRQSPLGYASGLGVSKYTVAPATPPDTADPGQTPTETSGVPSFRIPEGAKEVTLNLWDQRGVHVAEVFRGSTADAGLMTIDLTGSARPGPNLPAGHYLFRLEVDGEVGSGQIFLPE